MWPHFYRNVIGALSCHVTTSYLPLLMLLVLTKGVMHRNTQQQCHLIRSEPSTFLPLWQCVLLSPLLWFTPYGWIERGVLHFTRRGQHVWLISGYQVRCEYVEQCLISRTLRVVQAAWNLLSGVFVKKLQIRVGSGTNTYLQWSHINSELI